MNLDITVTDLRYARVNVAQALHDLLHCAPNLFLVKRPPHPPYDVKARTGVAVLD
jgi:hypothetical protein